ncbi:MAG: alpha/beta hydrolase [Sphingomonadales bacterium]|nr:alpha/beta hydrolase [Sphingomonadales bacterium]
MEDLDAIINKINTPIILLGQSWGSVLAAAYLSKYPHKITSIIFISPGPIYPLNPNLNRRDSFIKHKLKRPAKSNKVASDQVYNIRMQTIRMLATRHGIKLAKDDEADDFALLEKSKTNKSCLCDTSLIINSDNKSGYFCGIMTYYNLLRIKDFRDRINGKNLPVLVLKGQCDNQPLGAANEYLELFPNSQFKLITNAGHFISFEQHENYKSALIRFLRQYACTRQ